MTRSTLLRPLRLGAVVALLALMTPQAAAYRPTRSSRSGRNSRPRP